MKKDSKSKAKSPPIKRAQKSAAMSTKAAASKSAAAGKAAGTKARTAAVKAKAPAEKTKATKAERAAKPAPKSEKPKARSKATGAAALKAKTAEAAPGFRIGEPVLDPIGDVISGEARTYLGEVEAQGRVEMDAWREETEIAAVDGTLEGGPESSAASADGAAAGEDAAEEEAGKAERPPAKLERLQKILSQAGIASRRRAEEMIVAGRVIVNGQVVTQLGTKADAARDHIRVDGKLLQGAERHRYFVLNKPKGYVTTVSDPEGRPTVMAFFAKMKERLYPVGRLDYQSEGLLLMTNDGELANLLTKAGSGVEKVYLVKVAGQPTEEELDRLRRGIAIERGEAGSERVMTAPARIRQVRVGENPWYEVVLTEGRNRELRKMFAAIGHFAEKIRRVGYGPLVLDVEPGKLRELTADEVNALRLTAEGKMKPRRMRVDISLPKEAGKAAEKQRRFADSRGRGERGAKPWRDNSRGDRPAGKRFDGPRGATADRAQERGGKPFGQREERGQRTEWKPREDRGPRKDWTPRERPFDARGKGKPFRREERAGFGERPGKPFRARPEFGGGRESGARHSGERKEWKPREQSAGRFDGAPRKPFRGEGERPRFDRGERPAFARPAGSFKRSDGPKKRFDGDRDSGTGKSFGGGARGKERWVPRPGRARNEEGRAQTNSGQRPAPAFGEKRWEGKRTSAGTGRPKPAFGARPGGFKRPGGFSKPGSFSKPGKPGGFKRPGGSSRPNTFSKAGRPGGGANHGGARFGRKRPDAR